MVMLIAPSLFLPPGVPIKGRGPVSYHAGLMEPTPWILHPNCTSENLTALFGKLL